MVFLTNESGNKAEINIFVGTRYDKAWILGPRIMGNDALVDICMYACLRLYMPRVGSRQASLNKLIWCKILCYLLCSGDKINNFSKTNVYFHKKTTPQLLGHQLGYKI